MPNVRGIFVINTLRFVRETYGAEVAPRIVDQLPREMQPTFLGDLREASWKPLAHALAFMEAAQRTLAPGDAGFHYRLGRYTGHRARVDGGYLAMAADPATATRMAPIMWRTFYDAGRLEVEPLSAVAAVLRVRDFPAHAVHCERLRGAWEAMVGGDKGVTTIVHTACAAAGAPVCTFDVRFEPAPAGGGEPR